MRNVLLLLLIFSCSLGCRNTIVEQSPPFICNDQTLNKSYRRATFQNSKLSVSIPIDWVREPVINSDTSLSVVCLDTALLFNSNLVRSITLTTIDETIADPVAYIKKEITRMENAYQVIINGYQEINEYEAYWVLLKDRDLYNLIYYFFDDKVYLANLSCSASNDYEQCLCQLIDYFKTIS